MIRKDLIAVLATLNRGSLSPEHAAFVDKLAAAKKLPAGMDKAAVESAKTSLEGATSMWAEAGTAFGAGDLMAAVAKAGQVKATVTELSTKLGLSATAAEPAKAAPVKK